MPGWKRRWRDIRRARRRGAPWRWRVPACSPGIQGEYARSKTPGRAQSSSWPAGRPHAESGDGAVHVGESRRVQGHYAPATRLHEEGLALARQLSRDLGDPGTLVLRSRAWAMRAAGRAISGGPARPV